MASDPAAIRPATTLIDSCVLLDVITGDKKWADWSAAQIAAAVDRGRAVINPLIYAEVSVSYETVEELDELLPADGYYEGQSAPEGGKAPKQPFYIYRTDGGILAFAGIYELWRDGALPSDSEQAWLWTASIITTDATDEIGKIHDRTPMVIPPEDWADWLDPATSDKNLLMAAMRPASFSGTGGLTSHLVSTAVNSVRNNGPGLIARLGDGGPGSPGGGDQPSLF